MKSLLLSLWRLILILRCISFQLLVLKYVQNKDVFMRYHKAHLTRRLILDTSSDSEKEENMVEWLREVGMPADYVNKLARMFQDIKVSQDLNQQFKEQCRAALADSINIKVVMSIYRIYARFYLKLKQEKKRCFFFVQGFFFPLFQI